MHPIVADGRRLALYLLAWAVVGGLLVLLVIDAGTITLRDAAVATIPPTMVFGFVCLASWYQTRALPLAAARVWVLLVAYMLAALGCSSLWLQLLAGWARLLGIRSAAAGREFELSVAGALLYLLVAAFHYLIIGLEETRRLEHREMEVRVLAREAELKMLKAQLDPHFLFNSLNSISSLCGSNPASARTLTTLLAEYLRKSLRAGSAEAVSFSEELELASSYLAVERIRFGPRLEVEQEIEESVRSFLVPPLLLQPLVENAVTHGIGHLVEGGAVVIRAARDGHWVRISVENRCDPDRPVRVGHGIGLSNTRKRMETYYGPSARLELRDEPERFRVLFVLPGAVS